MTCPYVPFSEAIGTRERPRDERSQKNLKKENGVKRAAKGRYRARNVAGEDSISRTVTQSVSDWFYRLCDLFYIKLFLSFLYVLYLLL